MSPVTLPSSRTLLLCACAERPRPSYSFFFFRFRCQPEMPPDAGHGKRESAPATIPGCHVWPVFQPSCPAVANRSNGRQDHFQTDAAGGTPATASHARMTMTVTGLPSRRQESEAFPCHCTRHSFGSLHVEMGTDMAVIQAYLGHKNITTTQIYSKIAAQQMCQVVDKITLKRKEA